jgi:pimeloyl-ACP methyl ester carboxylesterase
VRAEYGLLWLTFGSVMQWGLEGGIASGIICSTLFFAYAYARSQVASFGAVATRSSVVRTVEQQAALDLFWPDAVRQGPVVVFVHGGYWQRSHRLAFSHLAQGLLAHGVAVAMPSYDLCPGVTLSQLVEQVRDSVAFLHRRLGRRFLATGHSAGGHLTTMLMATDWRARGVPDGIVPAGMPISGLFDLEPLIQTTVNTAVGLDAAEAVDDIGAGKMLGSDDGRCRLAVEGRRAGDDAGHAGDLGGDDGHVGGGQKRVFAAGNVAADGLDRDVLVAEDDAGHGFDLDVLEGGALVFGEVFHLRLGELDVCDVAGGQLGQTVLNFGVGQPVVVA